VDKNQFFAIRTWKIKLTKDPFRLSGLEPLQPNPFSKYYGMSAERQNCEASRQPLLGKNSVNTPIIRQ
jgi:hypothetical protein